MAAPVTHILLAHQVFKKYFATKNPRDFYIGTSFPDIRYLGHIERQETHFAQPSLSELITLPAFAAGLKFHSLVDLVREDFVRSRNAYSLVPESPYLTQALKLFEDQVLYDRISTWPEIIKFFDDILPAETAYSVPLTDIQNWHRFLQAYLSYQPDSQSIRIFVAAIGRPVEMAEEMIRLVELMQQSPELRQIVVDLYEGFEQLIAD
jgi:hypothetical protein